MNFLIFRNTVKKRKMIICSNDVEIVVCDIDGTLTHDGTVYPSSYTLNVIEKLHAKGIGFGLASGRGSEQLNNIMNEWGLSFVFDLTIGLNGSEYYDGKKDEYKSLYMLNREDIKDIITGMITRFPELNVSIYRNGMRLLRFEDDMAVESKKRTGMDNLIVSDLSEMWDEPCSKVMFRVTEEQMEKIEPFAKSLANDRFRDCKTQTTMMEFVHAKANKGNCLKAYCENSGIDIRKTIAFGDMSNDNELLEAAGIGVCMINGSADCKASADYITEKTNNEDGCADFIERYILNGEELL